MKFQFFFLLLALTCVTASYSQHYVHEHRPDSSKHVPHQKPEKGPNHGKMLKHNGVNLEMVTPSNTKKHEVSYFLYDTLSNPIDAKTYTGTVKYVFGGPNQYIEVYLVPTGKSNQYVATLEDWNDFKRAIITLKADGKIFSTYTFFNTIPVQSKQAPGVGGGHTGQHGSHHGGGGGNSGGMNSLGGGGMR